MNDATLRLTAKIGFYFNNFSTCILTADVHKINDFDQLPKLLHL